MPGQSSAHLPELEEGRGQRLLLHAHGAQVSAEHPGWISKLVEAAYDLTSSACQTPFFADGELAQQSCCMQAFVNTLLNLCLLVRDTAAALENLECMRDHVNLEDQGSGKFTLLQERVTSSKLLQALDQTAGLSDEFTVMAVALKLAFYNDGVKATLVQKNLAKKSSAELLKQQASEGSPEGAAALSPTEKVDAIAKFAAMHRPVEVPMPNWWHCVLS